MATSATRHHAYDQNSKTCSALLQPQKPREASRNLPGASRGAPDALEMLPELKAAIATPRKPQALEVCHLHSQPGRDSLRRQQLSPVQAQVPGLGRRGAERGSPRPNRQARHVLVRGMRRRDRWGLREGGRRTREEGGGRRHGRHGCHRAELAIRHRRAHHSEARGRQCSWGSQCIRRRGHDGLLEESSPRLPVLHLRRRAPPSSSSSSSSLSSSSLLASSFAAGVVIVVVVVVRDRTPVG